MIPQALLGISNLPELENFIRQSLSQLLHDIHSPSTLGDVWTAIRSLPGFQILPTKWPVWTTREKKVFWDQFSQDMERLAYATRPYCLRCGECCRKGSPTLYQEDIEIIRKGIVPRESLITLRQGETGFSFETQDLMILPEERLKVREKPGIRECLYFNPDSGGCAIYETRPIQCRDLECWNPEKFQDLSSRTFLSRKDLINPADRLLPVMEAHEERCSIRRFRGILATRRAGGASLQDEALEMISYDLHLRGFLQERHGLKAEALTFLFGRPLSILLPAFGFKLEDVEGSAPKLTPLYL
jgi:Fe-S-cluster containining protein